MSNTTPSATNSANAFLADLQARGLVYQSTNGLAEHLSEAPRTLYCGFDPTADSLHIGSLVPLLTLRRFQQAGHTPIVLVGGATGLIGDPSFKAQERKLNSTETVSGWVEKLRAQTSRFVDFTSQNAARMANNYDWTHGISVLEFLRDVGKHFSVNQMIAKDAVKTRLEREESGISYTEFSYALLQAFDFLHLYKTENCTIQIGGSDQWGNITAGTDLVHKAAQGKAFGLTLPLVTKADGTKFGKTESGTIWLDAVKTSPYAFYQFFLNTADADLENFLKYFSFRPLPEIDGILKTHAEDPGKRLGQATLAADLTELVHGTEALKAAQRISAALFGGNLEDLTADDYAQLAQDGLPTAPVEASGGIIAALTGANLATSNREARDFIKSNGVQHNGQPVADESFTLTPENAKFGKYHLLRRGKKNFALLVHA